MEELMLICGRDMDTHLHIEKTMNIKMNPYHILVSAANYGCVSVINHVVRDHTHTLYLIRHLEHIIHQPLIVAVKKGHIDAVGALISFLIHNRCIHKISMDDLILIAIQHGHKKLSLILYRTYGSDNPTVSQTAMLYRDKVLCLYILRGSHPYYNLEMAVEWGDRDILETIDRF